MQRLRMFWSLLCMLAIVACAAPQAAQRSAPQRTAATAATSPSVVAAAPEATSIPPAATADSGADQTNDVYADPRNRFSVPIPTGWTAEQRDSFVALSDS